MKRKHDHLEQILHHLRCPITLELPRDPVTCEDGQTYERHAILTWLANHETSPITKQRITSNFRDAVAVKNVIEEVLNAYPEQKAKWLKQPTDAKTAQEFVDTIRNTYITEKKPHIYHQMVKVLLHFRAKSLKPRDVVRLLSKALRRHPEFVQQLLTMIPEFSKYTPPPPEDAYAYMLKVKVRCEDAQYEEYHNLIQKISQLAQEEIAIPVVYLDAKRILEPHDDLLDGFVDFLPY